VALPAEKCAHAQHSGVARYESPFCRTFYSTHPPLESTSDPMSSRGFLFAGGYELSNFLVSAALPDSVSLEPVPFSGSFHVEPRMIGWRRLTRQAALLVA
jgi:hypothetical protein